MFNLPRFQAHLNQYGKSAVCDLWLDDNPSTFRIWKALEIWFNNWGTDSLEYV